MEQGAADGGSALTSEFRRTRCQRNGKDFLPQEEFPGEPVIAVVTGVGDLIGDVDEGGLDGGGRS